MIDAREEQIRMLAKHLKLPTVASKLKPVWSFGMMKTFARISPSEFTM